MDLARADFDDPWQSDLFINTAYLASSLTCSLFSISKCDCDWDLWIFINHDINIVEESSYIRLSWLLSWVDDCLNAAWLSVYGFIVWYSFRFISADRHIAVNSAANMLYCDSAPICCWSHYIRIHLIGGGSYLSSIFDPSIYCFNLVYCQILLSSYTDMLNIILCIILMIN